MTTAICRCTTPDPENCPACQSIETYRARDARITIGMPILKTITNLSIPVQSTA
jgi:hypothetical protein